MINASQLNNNVYSNLITDTNKIIYIIISIYIYNNKIIYYIFDTYNK